MNDTNYIGGVVKILETPKQPRVKNKNIVVIKLRAQIPQLRNSRLVTLAFWGNLARDILTYYKVNDYLLIEGYLSLRNKTISPARNQKPKKVEITVLKVYPVLLNYNRSIPKIENY